MKEQGLMKKTTCKTQDFYILFAFLLMTIALSLAVSVYCCFIKYWPKQKHLLPFLDKKNDLKNKNINPNNIKIDEKWYKNIFIYYIGYVTIKDLNYVKLNTVNPWYFIFRKVNNTLKMTNSDEEVPLNEIIEVRSIIIVVRPVFFENNKYCAQVFLNECLYKL